MDNPNQRQVAGTHYAGKLQHWDYVIAARLGYFEGQITKYALRYRKKNGAEDVRKALHYLDKLEWALENGKMPWAVVTRVGFDMPVITNFLRENEPSTLQRQILTVATHYTRQEDLHQLRGYLTLLLAQAEGETR